MGEIMFFQKQEKGILEKFRGSCIIAVLVSVLCFTYTENLFSQELIVPVDNGRDSAFSEEGESNTSKSVVRNVILYGTVPFVFFFGVKAWHWGDNHDFTSQSEGWLGKDTDYAGADKVGHFYAHYVIQRSVYDVFNWTENGGDRKWIYSVGVTAGTGLLIEIGDGFSSKYGFSYEDLVADYAGILCGAVLDYSPMLNGFIGFSVNYWPSDNFADNYDRHNFGQAFLDFVTDYSGYTYLMNFKLAGFRNLGVHLPLALRLIQLDIGYETRGYGNADTHAGVTYRERNLRFGISLNSAQLLDESWEWKRGGGYHTAHRFLEFYEIPVHKTWKAGI